MKSKVLVASICSVIVVIVGLFSITRMANKAKMNNQSGDQSTSETTTVESTKSILDGLGDNDTFSSKTESGKVEVVGYAYKKTLSDYDGNSKSYIYFKIMNTNSKEFLKYLKNLKGNSFVGDEAIGLGCMQKGQLTYYNENDSDKDGIYDYTFSEEDTNTILHSNRDNPVRLLLNKKKFTGGGEAGLCYSHITTVEIVNVN